MHKKLSEFIDIPDSLNQYQDNVTVFVECKHQGCLDTWAKEPRYKKPQNHSRDKSGFFCVFFFD